LQDTTAAAVDNHKKRNCNLK